MSKKGPQIQEELSPNLIPMIDIMFLLLLFLMVSADMGQRELEEVMLPKAKSIKADKGQVNEDPSKDRLTINVYHRYESEKFHCAIVAPGGTKEPGVCRDPTHWLIGIKGQDYGMPGVDYGRMRIRKPEELQAFLDKDAASLRNDPKNPTVSERRVMIRADKSSPYGVVQAAMNACMKVGIYKIEAGAAQLSGEEPKKKSE